jgi:hypothetical protein
MKMKLLLVAGVALSMSALAQTNSQSAPSVEPMAQDAHVPRSRNQPHHASGQL